MFAALTQRHDFGAWNTCKNSEISGETLEMSRLWTLRVVSRWKWTLGFRVKTDFKESEYPLVKRRFESCCVLRCVALVSCVERLVLVMELILNLVALKTLLWDRRWTDKKLKLVTWPVVRKGYLVCFKAIWCDVGLADDWSGFWCIVMVTRHRNWRLSKKVRCCLDLVTLFNAAFI